MPLGISINVCQLFCGGEKGKQNVNNRVASHIMRDQVNISDLGREATRYHAVNLCDQSY